MRPETSYYLSQGIRYTGVDNVVVNMRFGCTIPLLDLVREYPNVEYKPQRFSAAIVRSGRPLHSTALVFRTGSTMIVGTPNIDISRFAMQCYRKMLSARGHVTDCLDFCMVNVVCTSHMKHCVHLPRLATLIPDRCIYEPNLFPGLVCPMGSNSLPGLSPDRKILALVFDGGATVVMGIHGSDELTMVMERLLPFIMDCRISQAELDEIKRERAIAEAEAAAAASVAAATAASLTVLPDGTLVHGAQPSSSSTGNGGAGGGGDGNVVSSSPATGSLSSATPSAFVPKARGGIGGTRDGARLHQMLAKVDISSPDCVKDLMELFKDFKAGNNNSGHQQSGAPSASTSGPQTVPVPDDGAPHGPSVSSAKPKRKRQSTGLPRKRMAKI